MKISIKLFSMLTRLYQYRLPIDTPKWKWREGLILQCGDCFGEIAPLPGFSGETLDEAREETLQWIRFQKRPSLPSVRFGIACAQQPLRSVHLPLCALGEPREGFSTLKLKLGHLSLKEAIATVEKYVGRYRLRLDCNRSWTLDQALEFALHFKKEDFVYLEEPVRHFEELIAFSEKTSFPIALDESIQNNWEEIPSLKAIVVKPTLTGAIPSVPSHLDLVLSSSYESGLGLLHIANRATTQIPLGIDTYKSLQEDILTQPILCSQGYISWSFTNPPVNLSRLCAL